MVCPLADPPVRGGAERLWEGIVDQINARTSHDADLVAVPSPEASLPEVVRSYAEFDELDLSDYDLVISGKYPAWMVRHPRHVIYMAHPLRGLYDTYSGSLELSFDDLSLHARTLLHALDHAPGRPGARRRVLMAALALVDALPADHRDLAFPGPLARQVVQWLDRDALHRSNVSGYLAISGTVATRRGYFPHPDLVEVCVPPSGLEGLHGGPGKHLFTASRLDHPKRIDLLIDAMRFVDADIELRIAGTGPQEKVLRERAASDPRIRFVGSVGDDQLIEEYASAIAVPFVPIDEDLGLIAIEAQMSRKPVVTCSDSGGPTELVEGGVDGFVVSPTARNLGEAMSRLVHDPALAEQMGTRAFERARTITWDRVLDALLRDRPPIGRPRRERPSLVVLSTYPAQPAHHGGQVRLHRLLTALSRRADVNLLAVAPGELREIEINPAFRQTTVPPTAAFHELDYQLTQITGAPTGDIAATLGSDALGELPTLALAAARDADAVILAHPYLFPLVRSIEDVPIIYDAHNAEHELKRVMYAGSEEATAVAEAVRDVEVATIRASTLITAPSTEDIRLLQLLTPTLADFRLVPNGGDVCDRSFTTGISRRLRREFYLQSLRPAGVDVCVRFVALFVGSGHPPNVDAAMQILETAARMPDVLFVLAGAHVDALPGIPNVGNVLARGVVNRVELDQLLCCCDVALNPMSTGSGTNIKMIDYFAAGAPVVSTAVGARGLGATAGVHYLEAELDGLGASIAATLGDVSGAARRSLAARELAEAFDWARLGEQFTEAVMFALRL